MKMFPCTLLSLMLTSSCSVYSPHHNIQVVYTNDWQEKWKADTLKECKETSVILTLRMYEAHPEWTKDDVVWVEKWILDSCALHHDLTI